VARLSIHLIVGVLIGLVYYRVGNDAAHVFDNFGLLYFCIMFLMFTAFSSMILTCKWTHDIEHRVEKKHLHDQTAWMGQKFLLINRKQPKVLI